MQKSECTFDHEDPPYFTRIKCSHFNDITVEMYTDEYNRPNDSFSVFAYRKVDGKYDPSFNFGMDIGIPSSKVADAFYNSECERMFAFDV